MQHFICVSFYSPPRSKLNGKLLDHLQFNLNRLTAIYPGSAVILGGDVNNLSVEKLRNCFPDLVNMVAVPTHGSRVLDVVVSDLHVHYDKAVVLPPIQPDDHGHGKPSDHKVAS